MLQNYQPDMIFDVIKPVAKTILGVGNEYQRLSAISKFRSQAHTFIVGEIHLAKAKACYE